METKQWPSNYQQSVATALERTDEMFNGNTETSMEKTEPPHNTGNDNNENLNDEAEEPNLGNNQPNITISEKAKQTIQIILEQIKSLSQAEKFLLHLKLPAEVSNVVDPFRQPLNPLGSRSEIYRTMSWIKTHLEEDPETSLPKQEVYDEYFLYCKDINIKQLSQADFGKVMKQVYPKVRARRLGTRGKSRYCYSGLRRCFKLKPPVLPDLSDKQMSTEPPCNQSSLASAAWVIVRDWSLQQLGIEFSSLNTLAYYLILNHSIGAGTEAANKLASEAESQFKEEDSNASKSGNKHREMQLQLQRKIQQKNEVNKERKRKMQLPKSDKPSFKKARSQSASALLKTETSPILSTCTAASECSTSSNSTSPTQGKTICDKSLDFTQLPALPDFNSFQKPIADGICDGGQDGVSAAMTNNKIAIPRLQSLPVQISPTKKQAKNVKYKAIQPRLQQQCDIASYNLQSQAAGNRSQDVHNVDKFKERKCSDDDCEEPDSLLSRKRLNSVSNVAKDAMDEYLGSNNSQHAEELSKYFTNNNVKDTTDPKLSTLRQLLEQNLLDNPSNSIPDNIKLPNSAVNQAPIQTNTSYITPQLQHRGVLSNAPNSVRRRVSFETPLHEDAVPPSPNTRRKNFSFTPISPGPQSPNNGVHSKCSSTNASPFVSPRNTPVPRTKNTMHQNAGIMMLPGKLLTVKKEIDLHLDLSNEKESFLQFNGMAVSAPASPMLQKLLNANSKVSYKPGYSSVETVSLQADASREVSQFFANNVPSNLAMNCRSQSVPLHQMVSLKTSYSMDNQFCSDLSEASGPANDFNEIDPIPESHSDNVKRILNSLDEQQQCDNNNIDVFNVDLSSNNQSLNEFGLHLINNNLEMPNEFPATDANNLLYANPITTPQQNPCPRNMSRSQSIDQYVSKSNQFRSVPSTPLPFTQNIKPIVVKNFSHHQHSSRSYPSTPLNTETGNFNYNLNGDCLLNGQRIRTDGLSDNLDFIPAYSGLNGEGVVEPEKGFNMDGQEFGIVENGTSIMDDNCILIEQSYSGNIN